jgi:hypothetical protein
MTMEAKEAYIQHITMTTGHSRRSSRAEVVDEAIAALAPVVIACERDGVAELPSPTGLMHLRRIVPDRAPSRHVACWAILEPQGPALVTMALAMDARAGSGLWRRLHMLGPHQPLAVVPPAPWLGVILHQPLAMHHAVHWLGDAERCIAWTWIEHVYLRADGAGRGRAEAADRGPARTCPRHGC